jgi:predicted methyltransferase
MVSVNASSARRAARVIVAAVLFATGPFALQAQQGASAAIEAAVAGGHRSAGNKARDRYRHARNGYISERRVVEYAENAGFELAGGSNVNDNPLDTHDHPEGVWTLPPDLALGERDRAKYLRIGESDRFTLKFVKPE